MIKLYNTMTRDKKALIPLEKGRVKIFTCGPSIYRRPHIGNYRTFIYEDNLVRFLEFKGLEVKRVINYTDVEDKTIEEAKVRNEEMSQMTSGTAEIFRKEAAELSLKLPDFIPSSSTSIDQAALILQKLIEKGHAYRYKGDIFFDPLTVKDFGKLFRLDMSRWPDRKVRFKKDTYNGNRWNLGDFILWHGDDGLHENAWDTVIGRGRPSWNIQDPAIITKHLGEQVDINCGGIDNIYRHHDYNIAIMEALTGKEYAGIYLHGEHLKVNGSKMSKSRGNILYPEDIFSKGYTPGELRFLLASGAHYRKKLNFTMEKMEESSQQLRKLRNMTDRFIKPQRQSQPAEDVKGASAKELIERLLPDFTAILEDDLNLSEGVLYLQNTLKKLSSTVKEPYTLPENLRKQLTESIVKIDSVLCCLL